MPLTRRMDMGTVGASRPGTSPSRHPAFANGEWQIESLFRQLTKSK